MTTFTEVREQKKRLLHKLESIVTSFELTDEQGKTEKMLLASSHMQAVQIAPGAWVRAAPLEQNGLSVLVWELPGDTEFPMHTHPVDERITVMRGEMQLVMYEPDGSHIELRLTPTSCAVTVPAGVLHGGKCTGRLVAVTTYEPSISLEDALNAI